MNDDKSTAQRDTLKRITHKTLEAAKPAAKAYPIAIGNGLKLQVFPNGSKLWLYRYRFNNKANIYSIGSFPDVSLSEAKDKHKEARDLLANGTDPNRQKKAKKQASKFKQENTFEAMVNEWAIKKPAKTASTARGNKRLLAYAIKAFGNMPISEITAPMVLQVCDAKRDAGTIETANRIKIKCGQIFRYAIATGRLTVDPTAGLRGSREAPQSTPHKAVIKPVEIGALLRSLDTYQDRGQLNTVCALSLAPLVFVRPGELRGARWADINFDAAEWRYTPPKTRNKTAVDLIVPLSRQAIAILRKLEAINGRTEFVFNAPGNSEGFLSSGAVSGALKRLGYQGVMTGHGFRAMARTVAREELNFPASLLEMQLGHAIKDPNGRAYDRTSFLPERREMMQAWADYLDVLRIGAEVVPITRKALPPRIA